MGGLLLIGGVRLLFASPLQAPLRTTKMGGRGVVQLGDVFFGLFGGVVVQGARGGVVVQLCSRKKPVDLFSSRKGFHKIIK